MPTKKNKAIFFDRDGVINERIVGGYVRNTDEFVLLPDVPDVLRELKQKDYLAIVVTNQRGVGLGLMSEAHLHAVHTALQDTMHAKVATRFDDIIFCTDIDDTNARRKPSPAMILEAADKWNIDLSQSWMVGDSMSDIEAGTRAGTKTAYLVTQHSEEIPRATKIIHDIKELLKFI